MRTRRRRLLATCATAILAGSLLVVGVQNAHAADTLLSQGRPALASSQENGGAPAPAAVDGRPDTRWGSAWSDPQWLRVDLGATATITSGPVAVGGRVRQGLPDPDVPGRQHLDQRSTARPTPPAATRR